MARQTGPAFHRRSLTLAMRQVVGSQGRTPARWISLLLLCTSSLAFSDSKCDTDAGRLESSEGSVAIETDGNWRPLAVGACVPVGVRIQIREGRAVFRLANETLLRASGSTLLRIAQPQEKNWIRLFDGLLHIITRTPHAFDVETDYVNAGVKGTEFILAANRSAQAGEIIMLEGEVLASNTQGEQSVRSGGTIVARAGQAPTTTTIPALRNAVQWTLYYPPVPLSNDARFQAAQQQLYRGNVAAALKQLDDIPQAQRDADYFAQLGAINLYRGEIEPARSALAAALEKQSDHPQALALQAMALLATGNADAAAAALDRAQTHSSHDSTVLIARSYLEQSRFELDAAQASAQKAVNADKNNALAHARLAELALTNGDAKLANTSIDTALRLQPEFGRALAIKGFAQLQQLDFDAAEASFKTATAQNPSDPLPHLGLGLINIRHNHVAEGREQLALAVALDPGQSLLRSYLGKAYQEEGREQLAADQYTLAKNFDAADPTPWLYSALLARVQNRPFDALDDLNQSIALNDNRAVYRSRLQLDADEAVRTASQAEIYRELGFDELAQRSAADAVSRAPGEYAGHRQLAESYADNPQYDAARASEVLQAQLLQPLSATPILPILGETNLFSIEGAGPGALGYREYNSMFTREKPFLSASALGGSNNTGAGEITLSGVSGRTAYALNQYHYETLGYRDNNDARYDVLSAYIKVQATEDWSVLLSANRREEDRGDIEESLLEEARIGFQNNQETVESILVGSQLEISDSVNLLMALSYEEKELTNLTGISFFGTPLNFIVDSDPRTLNAELQGQFSTAAGYIVAGIDWAESDAQTMLSNETDDPFLQSLLGPAIVTNQTDQYFSGYGYWTFSPTDPLDLTFGFSYAELNSDSYTQPISGWYPKFSSVYRLNPDIELRMAYFQTLHRPVSLEQTLEPTQLGGINQVEDEGDGIESEQFSVAIDIDAGHGHQLGAEAASRSSDIPFSQQFDSSAAADSAQARVFWSWGKNPWSVSASYHYETSEYENPGDISNDAPSPLTTHRLPLRIQWQSGQGWTLAATTTYINQNGDFYPLGTSAGATPAEDRFTLLDLAARIQFLKRHAEIELRVNNALDTSFRYQSTNLIDPTPRFSAYMPERVLLLGLKFSY